MMLGSTFVCSAHAVVTGRCREQLQAPGMQQQTRQVRHRGVCEGESMREQTSGYRIGVGSGDSSEPTGSRERQRAGPGQGLSERGGPGASEEATGRQSWKGASKRPVLATGEPAVNCGVGRGGGGGHTAGQGQAARARGCSGDLA